MADAVTALARKKRTALSQSLLLDDESISGESSGSANL